VKFKEDLQRLSVQISERQSHVVNEETAKQALVIPFLQVLGYDVFNPLEVKPEYYADFGKKKSEKVDYAIFKDETPIMFIEVKPPNEKLGSHSAQLARYFNAAPEVRIAVLTNGIEYKLFTDLDKNNLMDESPFFKFNINNLSEEDIKILAQFKKENFQTENIVKCAEELTYTSNLNKKLRELFSNPPDDFIKYLIRDFSDTRITTNVIERFRPIVKKSISMAIIELVSKGLLQDEVDIKTLGFEGQADKKIGEKHSKDKPSKKAIVTTEEEIRCFEMIRTFLFDSGRDVSELDRKDTISYFGIYYKNLYNWFIRLSFDTANKYIITKLPIEKVKKLAPDHKVEEAPKGYGVSRLFIESPDDLLNLKNLIMECYDDMIKNLK